MTSWCFHVPLLLSPALEGDNQNEFQWKWSFHEIDAFDVSWPLDTRIKFNPMPLMLCFFTKYFVTILSHTRHLCPYNLSLFRFPPAARTLILLGQEWQRSSLLQWDVLLAWFWCQLWLVRLLAREQKKSGSGEAQPRLWQWLETSAGV